MFARMARQIFRKAQRGQQPQPVAFGALRVAAAQHAR
jgi:hypothetical protein